MTSHNEHSVSREEVYVDRGSLTWWLTNPSDELSNFCVHYLLKLKWLTNKLVFNNMIGVWRVWLLINTLQTPLFACDKHIRWCRKKTIQFVVNTLYKKKKINQMIECKNKILSAFKNRQRSKEHWPNMLFQSILKEFSFYIIVGYCFWRLLSICTTFSKYI